MERLLTEEQRIFDHLLEFMRNREDEAELYKKNRDALKKHPQLARHTNKNGYTPLHVGIREEAHIHKLFLLLQDPEVAKQKNPAGRLPLHMALDYYLKEELLVRLIDIYPPAAKVEDVDTRLPLHILLELQPFPSFAPPLCLKLLSVHSSSVEVKYADGRLPLHMSLDRCMPPMLVLQIFNCSRKTAGIAKRDGKYPLHIALENDLDCSVVTALLEAYPAALLTKITISGRHLLPLEFAIKRNCPVKIISCLMDGGSSNSPKVMAYARAAATGQICKEFRAHGYAEDGLSTGVVGRGKALHMERKSGRLVLQEVDEAIMNEDARIIRLTVQTSTGILFKVLCDPKEKVEDLRVGVQSGEARCLHLQDKEGTHPDEQRLTFQDKQLMDGSSISSFVEGRDCNIRFRQRFEVVHEALRDLRFGLADHIILELLRLRPETAMEDDMNGVLPLHLAIMNNASEKLVIELMQSYPKAVKIEVNGTLGKYPLHLALSLSYSDNVIKELLNARSYYTKEADWTSEGIYDPGERAKKGNERSLPLHMAIQNTNQRHAKMIIPLLLNSKCPIGARDSATGYSAIECVLASTPSEELFRLVLTAMQESSPETLTEAGPTGQTPLHVACKHGATVDVMKVLCDLHMGSLIHYDMDRRLPIHLAILHRMSFPVIRMLVQRRPESVYKRDGQNRTPLQLAVMHHAAPGVVQLIIGGMDSESLHERDSQSRTVMELAVEANAPNWILLELLESCKNQAARLNLLTGRWSNTKAAVELRRMISHSSGDASPQQRRWTARTVSPSLQFSTSAAGPLKQMSVELESAEPQVHRVRSLGDQADEKGGLVEVQEDPALAESACRTENCIIT